MLTRKNRWTPEQDEQLNCPSNSLASVAHCYDRGQCDPSRRD